MTLVPVAQADKSLAEHWDVVVMGSGAAGLAAAVTAANHGMRVIVLERDHVVGGTSAISGGALWIPGTRQAKAGGFKDTTNNARLYLRGVLGEHFDPVLVETFLCRGPEALAFLEDTTELKYSVRALSPDYYPEIAGATECGRALEVGEFDGRRLGTHFTLLRPPPDGMMLFRSMMINRIDIFHFLNTRKSVRSLIHCARLIARFIRDRFSHVRGTRLVIGNAMVAQLLKSSLDEGVKFVTDVTVQSLLTSSDGNVSGVELRQRDGTIVHLSAQAGVVLATGGLGRHPRVHAIRPDTNADHLSMAAPFSDGTAIDFAEKLGAQVGDGLASSFYWAPMSELDRDDGTKEVFPHIVTDRAKPGIIAVNENGQRFVNEANSYHRFVQAMLTEQRNGVRRFYLIADSKALKSYGLGLARPSPGNNRRLVRNGYLFKASTIRELARRIQIDPAALATTIAEVNRDATDGIDRRFHKGDSTYNRAMGDSTVLSPCIASIAVPPFYAVRIHTGDLGSARGLRTDSEARVLRRDGSIIGGLYAAGSDMNSMMAGEYPGPGITLGPGLTFGYIAAMSMVERSGKSLNPSVSDKEVLQLED